ncbi:MAG: 1-acyl-sn-glycerol-3-phosphate acyltransferase [Taibaiella sp.]|nr:1-acyl-sn-glycerol-3-phosphate acyltransferase [Taibaiella sp.]
MFRKLLQPIYTTYVIVTFIAGLLITFPVFVLLALPNKSSTRRVIYRIVKVWATFWLWIIGMPLRVSGAKPGGGRHVVVANHISYMDTVVLFPALPRYFRPLGKKEMAKIPIFGFLYKQVGIMVDRSSPYSRAKSMRLMWRMLRNESDILIFPEGTFNETGTLMKDLYDGAFRLAINTQTPVLPVVFPDTVHRWHYSAWWKVWPGINRAILLPEVPVKGLTMDDLPALKQRVKEMMCAELAKYSYP